MSELQGTQHRRRDTVHFCETDLEQEQVDQISRVTWVGVAVNIALAIVKTVGGVMSGSMALLADAVHTVSDLATDAAILIGVRYWSAPADSDHPHGHHKIETLVTLGIGVALAAVGAKMGYDAVVNLTGSLSASELPEHTEHGMDFAAWLAFGAAAASIVGKELLYRWTAAKGVLLESSAVVANAWHHRSDAFSSIPPMLAIGGQALGGRFGYDLWYLDPVGTLVVCVMLLQAAWEVMRPTLAALLDASADRQLCSAIRHCVLSTPGVIGAHRIRTRVIGSNAVEVDLHITVDKELKVWEGHAIASKVKYCMLKLETDVASRVVDVMVHVEPADSAPDTIHESESPDTMVDWKAKSE